MLSPPLIGWCEVFFAPGSVVPEPSCAEVCDLLSFIFGTIIITCFTMPDYLLSEFASVMEFLEVRV